MGKQLKVVTIGGGSSYTPELIEGFILRHDKLPIKELWLVDIEEGREKLDIVFNLACRMVKKGNVDMKIFQTIDRREALKDADFVTTQIRVGQLAARVQDECIPNSFNLIGQETHGAGGFFKALRTIPVILDIVKDIQGLCPDAWMMNFSNPAGMVSEAIANYTEYKKSIGLCNLPIGLQNTFARMLGVDLYRVRLQIQGINHFIFVTDIFLDGESIFDEVIAKAIDADPSMGMRNIHGMKFSDDLLLGLGAIPCAYHNYYFHTREQLEKQLNEFKSGDTRGETVQRLEDELFEMYKDKNLDMKPPQLARRGGALYSEAACNLISSIYNNTCDIQYVNIPNKGTTTELPDDSVIEAACVITKDGPKPLSIGKLKPEVAGYVYHMKSYERLAIKTAVEGGRANAIAALNLNPLIDSDTQANKVFDALAEAHGKYLPQQFM